MRLYAGIATASLGAVSFVVMGAGIARIKAYQNDKGYKAYREGFTPDRHVCEEAPVGVEAGTAGAASAKSVAALCTRAKNWHAATIATGIIGGLGLAGGAALILTSDTVLPKITGKRSGWQLLPLSSFDTAGALLQAVF